MKCSKCGSEVKPNYKFCTKCGQPMGAEISGTKTSEIQVEKRNALNDSSHFSIKSKSPIEHSVSLSKKSSNIVEEIDVVKGKAVWNIGPGQLARRISETEFAQLDDLKGVVIQQGITAVVTVDGQFMGMLEGGYYEFATKTVKDKAKEQADKQESEEKEDETFLSKAGKVARRVWRFFTGTTKKEKSETRKRRRERVKQNIHKITSNSVVNITLINTRIFEILFGSSLDSDGYPVFEPLKVKTKVVDLDMGISLQMLVSDINTFLVNYLSDRDSISVIDIQRILQPSIINLLNRILRNLDYQREGLPEEIIEIIKKQVVNTIKERVHGIDVVQILDVTDNSIDFDRFRAVEHELFASEHELGYLQRTGEFRNRLTIETNSQEIQSARNEEDLRHALNRINMDHLLHDDEVDAFVELLESQKRLREAKTEEQLYEALQDLRKCRLVKDEDISVLEHHLLHNEIERNETTELLRLRVFQSTEEARIKAENALSDLELGQYISQQRKIQNFQRESELSDARHTVDITGLGIQSQRQTDDYNREKLSNDYNLRRRMQMDSIADSRSQAEFERLQRREDKMDDMAILERKAAIARENMQQMQAHEHSLEEMKRKNEALRYQLESTMSQEQIAASHMREIASLDANAQAEMAKMMSSENKVRAELLQQQQEKDQANYERMLEFQRQQMLSQMQQNNMSQQQMKELMQSMMGAMAQMGQNNLLNQQNQFAQQQAFHQQRYQDIQQLKNEYKEDAIRQQQRIDHTQDSALNYTTKKEIESKMIWCQDCGAKISAEYSFCPHCNAPLDK